MKGDKARVEVEQIIKKEDVLKVLREHMDEIRRFGVKRIGIFGSVVRGEAREDSDIDFVVEFGDTGEA